MRSLTRRTFLSLISMYSLTEGLGANRLFPVKSATAQPQVPRTIRLAHVSPRQGPHQEMARYALMGAQLGAEEANTTAEMFGSKVELIIEEAANVEQVGAVGRALTKQDALAATIGALDDTATAALSELTQQEKRLFLNAAARGGELRGRHCQRYTFHVIADLAMNVDAIGQWLLRNDQKRWYFLLSAGPHGQETYHRARRLLQAHRGLELGQSTSAPGQLDYAPLLEHLARQDIEVLFLALTGEDLRQFLRQYQASALPALVAGVPLEIITLWHTPMEQLRSLWVTSWYHQLERFSARELNKRFTRRFGVPAEAYAWANWAAVKLVVEGVFRTGSLAPADLVQYLEAAPAFDGHKGKTLTFREWNHQLRQPLYVVKTREAPPENPWDLFELVAEMPAAPRPGERVSEVLDSLGASPADRSCQLPTL